MEMNIKMGINHKLQLSPTVYNSLQSFAEFKEYFHNVYIRAQKDLGRCGVSYPIWWQKISSSWSLSPDCRNGALQHAPQLK